MSEVVNISSLKVCPGDLVLVEVREDLPEARQELLRRVLKAGTEDTKAHFLVLPENTLDDIYTLSLKDMLDFRDLLDTAIEEALETNNAGDA